MDYTLEFISTSDPKTNKRRNFEMRDKAGNLLTKNGFSAGDIPKVKDIEEAQEVFRRLGLKNTSLFGDHFVIAQDSGGKIIGAAVRCEFLVPVFWGLGTVVFRVVGTGPRGASARPVCISRLGWWGRWLCACRSLRYGFGGRC